ncbi:hypothetical protein MMC25_006000 [Agyrium rufum]|nr:hypothetical protein [Agyrium rufum]
MNGLQVEDGMAANGSVHTRVLRVLLRSQLNHLEPALKDVVSHEFDQQIRSAKADLDEWTRLASFNMAKRLITVVNCSVFFGERLAGIDKFVRAAEQYLDDFFVTAEVLRLTPAFLAPWLAPMLMKHYQASEILVSHLTPEIEERLRQKNEGITNEKHVDIIQFFVDSTTRKQDQWSATKIVQVLLGIWFASVHQPAIGLAYALDDICNHPEYVAPLRQEMERFITRSTDTKQGISEAPLLDCFLKESCRLHPSDSISVRRQAIQPFTFSDGTHLPVGDVACVPLRDIMRDSTYYPDSMTFNPHRFLNQQSAEQSKFKSAGFTETSASFPLWGLGRHACPGRYYAAHILKLILSHILLNYDVQMPSDVKPSTRRSFYWRSAIVPKASTSVLFRPRSRAPIS